MGNCCGGESEREKQHLTSNGTLAFQGEGRRLGTVAETLPPSKVTSSPMQRDDAEIPQPLYDSNLTEEDRAKIRADRAAAAEARLKKQGGLPKKPKKQSDAPLTGPNSQPAMRWTAG